MHELALGLAVPMRLLLDLGPVPLPLAHALTLLGGLLFLARVDRHHPLLPVTAAFAGWVALSTLRAPAGLGQALHLLIPAAWLLAAHRADPRWPRWLLVAGLVPILTSLALLAAGQPAEHVLHDVPRLHGLYRNLHGHAVAMALLVVVAGHTLLDDPDRRWRGYAALVGALASIGLLFTWVRTLLLFVALAAFVHLAIARRWPLLGGGALLALGGLLLSPRLQARFADLVSLLTFTPPEGGWGAIGSWRFRIWAESLAAFGEGPWWRWVVGAGPGGQIGLHKQLDTHLEYLSLLFQHGLIGLALWLALAIAALRLALRAGAPGRLAASLLVAVLVTNALSNEFLLRATLQWTVWGAVGLALRGQAPDRTLFDRGSSSPKK